MKYIAKAAMIAAIFSLTAPLAASATGTLKIQLAPTATVASNCVVDASPALAFPNYDPISANLTTDLTATVVPSAFCTKGQSLAVSLTSDGATGMKGVNSLDFLTFSIALTTSTDASQDGLGNVTPNTFSITGTIPHGQNVHPDSYVDPIGATYVNIAF